MIKDVTLGQSLKNKDMQINPPMNFLHDLYIIEGKVRRNRFQIFHCHGLTIHWQDIVLFGTDTKLLPQGFKRPLTN